MQTENELKELVKEKYGEIADQSRTQNAASCCGAGGCSEEVYNLMADDYTQLQGYNEDADLGLGCGLPTEFAKIKKGDTVIDLGSGAGNDCFVARSLTGETGKVIGIDFTEKMVAKARTNAENAARKYLLELGCVLKSSPKRTKITVRRTGRTRVHLIRLLSLREKGWR